MTWEGINRGRRFETAMLILFERVDLMDVVGMKDDVVETTLKGLVVMKSGVAPLTLKALALIFFKATGAVQTVGCEFLGDTLPEYITTRMRGDFWE